MFIGHDAGRSGAPFVLLHLIRWLREKHPNAAFDVLLLRGGELESEYRQVAEVFVVPADGDASMLGRGVRRLRRRLDRGRSIHSHGLPPFSRLYDVVVGNTIATLEYLEYFKTRGLRTVCWMHELEFVISSMFTRERFLELSRSIDCFITASRAVDTTLRQFGVTTESRVVYEISPGWPAVEVDAAEVRRELGFPDDCFLVGGGGNIEWRKGTDLFLQIAVIVSKTERDIRFVWVGGADPSTTDYLRIVHDLKRMSAADKIVFTGVTNSPEKYLSAIDVFALTSREDPFPLICLEAASLGKPTICFEGAGGMPEFVGNNAGAVVPYVDTNEFGDEIVRFHRDRNRLATAGKTASEKLRSEFSAEIQCEAIEQILTAN